MKRLFDITFASIIILLTAPLLLFISILIKLENKKEPIVFLQNRIGLNGKMFKIFKFRTMHSNTEKIGQLTVGEKDPRITKIGYWLRKFKIDELPQFINVIKGDMSIVGPRPEVEKYVKLYNQQQLRVLNIKPGITDYASISYIQENQILGKSNDPEKTYIENIMPKKLELNLLYIKEQSFWIDLKIICKTMIKIINR